MILKLSCCITLAPRASGPHPHAGPALMALPGCPSLASAHSGSMGPSPLIKPAFCPEPNSWLGPRHRVPITLSSVVTVSTSLLRQHRKSTQGKPSLCSTPLCLPLVCSPSFHLLPVFQAPSQRSHSAQTFLSKKNVI